MKFSLVVAILPNLVTNNYKKSHVVANGVVTFLLIFTSVFTNSIMTINVNRIANWPPISSIYVKRYISIDVGNLRGKYQKPSIVIAWIFDHGNGHFVKPNKVALKYFKKNVDPYAHVKVFNYVMKANAKTFEEYTINALIIC